MFNNKGMIPKGMRDIAFEKCDKRRKIENNLRDLFKKIGYTEIITPTLEYYNLFNKCNNTVATENSYKFIDADGSILLLRPDSTVPIARLVTSRMKDWVLPIKLFYNQNVFRLDVSRNGRSSEIAQSGIELAGISGKKVDLDILLTSIKALKECKVGSFKVEIGHAGIFKALSDELGLDEENSEILRTFIEKKNYAALNDMLDNVKTLYNKDVIKSLKMLPRLFGGKEVFEEAARYIKNHEALGILSYLESIYKELVKIGIEKYFMLDLGMVQHLDYYTGIIFCGYAQEVGEAVLSGGRYDKLYNSFNTPLPACGFAVNIDAVIENIEKNNNLNTLTQCDVLIHYDENSIKKAYEIKDKKLKEKTTCEMSCFDTLDEATYFAKEKGIKKVINIKNGKSEEILITEKEEN